MLEPMSTPAKRTGAPELRPDASVKYAFTVNLLPNGLVTTSSAIKPAMTTTINAATRNVLQFMLIP